MNKIFMEKTVEKALEISRMLAEHSAKETLAIDVSEVCSWCDYFVITTFNSNTHLRGLIDRIAVIMGDKLSVSKNEMKKGSRLAFSGQNDSGENKTDFEQNWVAIDFGYLVVHLFSDEGREFYQLEKLWQNGKQIFADRHKEEAGKTS